MGSKIAAEAVTASIKAATALAVQTAVQAQTAAVAAKVKRVRGDHEYREGTEHLDARHWEKAIEAFDRAALGKGERADAAFYWKAYAQHKLGRRDDALATLAALQSTYPSSRWLNDARQLEQEVRQASGQPASPEQQADEDLKLYAINSLIHTEPERAVPLLDKILSGSSAPKLKERALFVLAQTNWPKGLEVLAKAARGGLNPDLQLKAIRYLASRDQKQAAPLLAEVYGGTQDIAVKVAILDAWSMMKDKERLLAAAKSESSADLRERAIDGLGHARAEAELAQLYQTEQSPELKREILDGLFSARAHDRVLAVAKSETDPALRRRAIQLSGSIDKPEAAEMLRSLYTSENDPKTRQTILESLMRRKDAPALIDIARKETNPELKKYAVHALSRMKSKEANEFLIELLNK